MNATGSPRHSCRLVLLLVLVAVLLPSASVAMRPMYPYPLIGPPVFEPYHVLTADLDDDGLLDFIVTYGWGSPPPGVYSYLGKGDGTFQPPVVHLTSGTPSWEALGDFNEDGYDDLVVATPFDPGVSLFIGNGDGTFGPETRVATSDTSWMVSVGDFNNDNHEDLLASSRVLLGNGDGTFGPEIPLGPGQSAAFSTVADFNDDGFDDIARSGPSTVIRILLSNGDGTFTTGGDFFAGVDREDITAGDLNNDGIVDLAVVNPVVTQSGPEKIHVLLGNGDGTFSDGQPYFVGDEPEFIAISDMNEDGLTDLIVSNYFGGPASISVLLGTGGGQFADSIFVDALRSGAYTVAVGDFDGDGDEDLAKPCFWCWDVGILFGNGDGTFLIPDTAELGGGPQFSAVADLDNDGRLDLVTANEGTNDVSVLLANGAGSFAPEQRSCVVNAAPPCPPGSDPSALVIEELTGDSHSDLAVTNPMSNTVSILAGDGTGSFSFVSSLPLPFGGMSPSSIAAGDLDNDDDEDLLVVGEGSSRLAVLLGNGDGTFDPPSGFPTALGTNPTDVATGKLNADDNLDVVVSNAGSNNVTVLLGAGDGSFAAAPTIALGFGASDLVLDDLDGDLVLDLVVASSGTGVVEACLGHGDGTFSAPLGALAFEGTGLVLEDLNDDGLLDLANSRPAVRLGNGDGTFGPPQYFAGLGKSVAIGDFNLDARTDLVAASGGSSGVATIHLNQTGPTGLAFESDGETLVWAAVTGALSYDLYRGNVSSLVDIDDDGLPDSDYGSCLSGLDDDTRDTFFVDADSPSSGDGFFYLISVIDAEGDHGLGSTSSGLPRVPQAPCP